MALFQLRKKAREDAAAPPAPAQTVEAMRRRAIHRLIGAAVLVVAGVIGFPLFFDNQPRPIPVDLPIIIPEKGRQPALATPPANPALAAASAPARVAEVPAKPATAEAPSPVPPAARVAACSRGGVCATHFRRSKRGFRSTCSFTAASSESRPAQATSWPGP